MASGGGKDGGDAGLGTQDLLHAALDPAEAGGTFQLALEHRQHLRS